MQSNRSRERAATIFVLICGASAIIFTFVAIVSVFVPWVITLFPPASGGVEGPPTTMNVYLTTGSVYEYNEVPHPTLKVGMPSGRAGACCATSRSRRDSYCLAGFGLTYRDKAKVPNEERKKRIPLKKLPRVDLITGSSQAYKEDDMYDLWHFNEDSNADDGWKRVSPYLFPEPNSENATSDQVAYSEDRVLSSLVEDSTGSSNVNWAPPARQHAQCWVDYRGNFHLMGGWSSGRNQIIHDYWVFVDTRTQRAQETNSLPVGYWIAVDKRTNHNNQSIDRYPAVSHASYWQSSDGSEFYLFGGRTPSVTSPSGYRLSNEMWSWELDTITSNSAIFNISKFIRPDQMKTLKSNVNSAKIEKLKKGPIPPPPPSPLQWHREIPDKISPTPLPREMAAVWWMEPRHMLSQRAPVSIDDSHLEEPPTGAIYIHGGLGEKGGHYDLWELSGNKWRLLYPSNYPFVESDDAKEKRTTATSTKNSGGDLQPLHKVIANEHKPRAVTITVNDDDLFNLSTPLDDYSMPNHRKNPMYPGARFGHCAFYLPKVSRNLLFLFGGQRIAGKFYSDLWFFDVRSNKFSRAGGKNYANAIQYQDPLYPEYVEIPALNGSSCWVNNRDEVQIVFGTIIQPEVYQAAMYRLQVHRRKK